MLLPDLQFLSELSTSLHQVVSGQYFQITTNDLQFGALSALHCFIGFSTKIVALLGMGTAIAGLFCKTFCIRITMSLVSEN